VDRVNCGGGVDTVFVAKNDVITMDCEVINPL